MRYFVKKSKPSKKGLYLQIYKTNYVPGKGNQNKSYKVIGYASDLIASGIPDPVAYAQNLVDELNSNLPNRKEMKIGDISSSKNLGYFLIKSMIDYLDFDYILKLMSSNMKFHFNLSDFVRSMIYAQIVNPGSKHKAFEKVMPNIYGTESFSYDQILDTINYIGNDYQKFVELLNISIQKKWKRNTSNAYFDCTNYYFEIDLPKEDRQFGPSKEERHLPIIGQALLLDEDQIPIGMSLYPGNESEKPKIRESIENLKQRFDIDSRIVQVADKGLNCARNIYAASKAFVLNYSRALNEELKYRQIHVLAICPYWVETEFFDRAVEKDKKPVVIRYGKVYKAKDVIKKAIKDMESSKDVSLYGTINRIQILGMKVLPHRLVKKIWMIYQELDGTKEIR